MLPTRILATASALPARVVTTAELAERIGIDPERAVRATGVRERRWVEPGEDPLRYGARALTDALTAAGLRIDQLDLLIHASGGTPQPIPDGSAHLAELTGFRGGQAFSVHSTCVSALVGMHQAALQIATGQVRSAAVVSCEASSRGLDLTDPESSLLFGDGAAAVILGPAEREGQGIVRYLAQMWPEGAAATEIRAGGYRSFRPAPGDDLRDYAFRMDGKHALKLAHTRVPPFLEQLRTGLSTSLEGIDRVIPHQTSAAGMTLLRRYGWPEEKIETTLEHLGNVVAASIPLTLHQALEQGCVTGGDQVLLVGTGAGLTTTGMVLSW